MKRKMKCLLYLFFLCFYPVVSLSAQDNENVQTHVVGKGESLYSIANKYKVTQSEIVRLNPGSDQKIIAGSLLKIPAKAEETVAVAAVQEEIFHTVKSGETLYRLSVTYKVPSDKIIEANPGLTAQTLKIGDKIRIPSSNVQTRAAGNEGTNVFGTTTVSTRGVTQTPKCKGMYVTEDKETLYSISRKFSVSVEELVEANPELEDGGVKPNQNLCIPYTKKELEEIQKAAAPIASRQLQQTIDKEVYQTLTIKTAIILPAASSDQAESDKRVEFYKGFVQAIDSLKSQNIPVDLYVYNVANDAESIYPILAKEELKQMNIIFAPLYEMHIKPLAMFSDENDIKLVIPFVADNSTLSENPNIYLLNAPQSYVYSEVYDNFIKQFPNSNVIILDGLTADKDKGEFINGLRLELNMKEVPTQTISGDISLDVLKSALRSDKKNVFIPTSSNSFALNKVMPQLQSLMKEYPTYNIHLFGYPEWQSYSDKSLNNLFDLNTYIYSSYYTDHYLPTNKYENSFHKWYMTEMKRIYPTPSSLGFDSGYYFLSGLEKYGKDLEYNLTKINSDKLQTGFNFERVSNLGGYINKDVFFVHYTKENTGLTRLNLEKPSK